MAFLTTGNKRKTADLYDEANKIVKFKFNGKNYIGFMGTMQNLLNNHPHPNQAESYKTDAWRRNHYAFVGYTYEGDTPPKVTKQGLAAMYTHQMKDIFHNRTTLFDTDKETKTKFFNIKEYDPNKDSEIKDVGDIETALSKMNNKDSSNKSSKNTDQPSQGNPFHTNKDPKKMAEEIYKEHPNDRNFVAKKITALRGLINKYKFTMNNTHDGKIKSMCKTVINKIIEVIDHLLEFIHKGINRF